MSPEIKPLVDRAKNHFDRLTSTIDRMSDEELFSQPTGKWSPAQHLQHLIIATKTSTAAFALPKFIVRLVGGTTKSSRTYDQLVADYREKLQGGAKASGRYIPNEIDKSVGKEKLLLRWNKATTLYLQSLGNQNDIDSLRKVAVKHPILQKISLLELAYFTIYHTEHHLNLIKN